MPDHRLPVHLVSYSLKYRPDLPPDMPRLTHLFDCRSIDNPGRIESLKRYTGRDQAVIDYLSSNARAEQFRQAIDTLIIDSLPRYLERDYGAVAIGFGCTGGQHRSVYFAEALHRSIAAQADISERLMLTLSHLDIDSRYGQHAE